METGDGSVVEEEQSHEKETVQPNAWDSFIAYVRGLSDTPTEDEKLKPTIVEPVKDDKNVLLLSHSSKVYRLALHDLRNLSLSHRTKAMLFEKKMGSLKASALLEKNSEERKMKARLGWKVIRQFIDEQVKKKRKLAQINRWRLLDRLAQRARGRLERRELYIRYGIIPSPEQTAAMRPSREMSARVNHTIETFKRNQVRPLTAPVSTTKRSKSTKRKRQL